MYRLVFPPNDYPDACGQDCCLSYGRCGLHMYVLLLHSINSHFAVRCSCPPSYHKSAMLPDSCIEVHHFNPQMSTGAHVLDSTTSVLTPLQI